MGFDTLVKGVTCYLVGIILTLDIIVRFIYSPITPSTSFIGIALIELLVGLSLFYYGKNLIKGR